MTSTPVFLFISTHLDFFTFSHKLIWIVDWSAQSLSRNFFQDPLAGGGLWHGTQFLWFKGPFPVFQSCCFLGGGYGETGRDCSLNHLFMCIKCVWIAMQPDVGLFFILQIWNCPLKDNCPFLLPTPPPTHHLSPFSSVCPCLTYKLSHTKFVFLLWAYFTLHGIPHCSSML